MTIYDQVSASRTSKGAVVAPWGYGKTSTLIFTWHECEDAGVLAVPPFIASSLQDILEATYGWLRFKLGDKRDLEDLYQHYRQAALEERVKAYASETGVSEGDARAILERARRDGSFAPELAAVSLMKFLEYASQLAVQSGMKGLVVLADEMEHFFNKTADTRGSIQKLRDMVWWLASHNDLPLGVIYCMVDTIEGMIREDAQAITDRLKEDHLYIDLRNIYSPEFPQQLWDRYVEYFDASDCADQILDRPVLASVGQIATREDLGRGPRTVIDVFQCALRHYDKTGERYSPLTLIDDFLLGQITFDMQANPIRFAVEDAFAALKNQISSEDHRKAIKLWAAFPEHGCPDEVLATYGAKEAGYELSDMHGVHGPLLTYQSVGYTLRKLAAFTPGGTAIERVARDFWLAYREQDPKWAEAAQAAFVSNILPRVFEKKRAAWGNWEAEPTVHKGYKARLTGSFIDQYPDRIVDVQVAHDPSRIEPRSVNARSDFQFDFVLACSLAGSDDSGPSRIEFVGGDPRWVRFTLSLDSRTLAGATLPQDLRNLKSSIHPNFLTPRLMLAFVDFVSNWNERKPESRILDSERGPVNAIVENMLNYSIKVLFDDELRASFSKPLNFASLQIVREIFQIVCHSVWPVGTYFPLLTIPSRAIDDYINALARLSLREKRGDVPLSEHQKGKLASLFGLESHKAYESRAKSDYSQLADYKDLGGDQAQVQLRRHPLEDAILDELVRSEKRFTLGDREIQAIEGGMFLDIADRFGYRHSEAVIVLKLLLARQLIGKDDTSGVIYRLPSGPSIQDVERGMKALQIRVYGLPAGLVGQREKDGLLTRFETVKDRFTLDLDEESLEQLSLEISRLDRDLGSLVDRKRQDLLEDVAKRVQEVQSKVLTLGRATELDQDIPGGMDFRRHVVDLQEALNTERRRLTSDLSKLQEQLVGIQKDGVEQSDSGALTALFQKYTSAIAEATRLGERSARLDHRRKGLKGWLELLKDSDSLYKSLSTMPDLRARLTDEVFPEIMRNFNQKYGQRDIEGLADSHEQFRGRFDEIARDRDGRIAAGNEAFGECKGRWRQWLARMGVDRSDFPARYSPVEHEQSYQDMYAQVMGIAKNHLSHLSDLAKELNLDLLRARRIHLQKFSDIEKETLSQLDEQREAVQTELSSMAKWLDKVDLSQAGNVDDQADQIATIGKRMTEIDEMIRGLILRPVEPQTAEEKKVMALLSGRREADLTELALSAGNDLDLEAIAAGLLGLYRGNQVSIKVQKRG